MHFLSSLNSVKENFTSELPSFYEPAAVSFGISFCFHVSQKGLTTAMALGALSVAKVACDRGFRLGIDRVIGWNNIPKWKFFNQSPEFFRTMFCRLTTDFVVTMLFSGVFRPEVGAPLMQRLILQTFVSYILGKKPPSDVGFHIYL